ncbi:agouti-related protein [Genypterus blacodes]|uniref:agouti-related protein n=1 Tax=Genypterus blacodes TaxID=154954 RepID=UPI003F777A49
MFSSLLLCCFTFSLIRLSVAVVHGNMQLQEGPAGRRRPEPAFLSEIDQWTNGPDPALLSADSGEEHFLIDTESYDKDSAASALQLQGRSMRSPRRCIPHQQSCLGFALPCCDPCDTCYCRFFNAICYCRRVGHTCNPRRT